MELTDAERIARILSLLDKVNVDHRRVMSKMADHLSDEFPGVKWLADEDWNYHVFARVSHGREVGFVKWS